MADDPSSDAADNSNLTSKHSLYEKYGLCFFALMRRCTGV